MITLTPAEDKEVLIDDGANDEEEFVSPGTSAHTRSKSCYFEVPLTCPLEDVPQNSSSTTSEPSRFLDQLKNAADFSRPSGAPGSNNIHNDEPVDSVMFFLLRRVLRVFRQFQGVLVILKFHQKLLVSSILVVISCAGCLIFFPLHLENITKLGDSDGYCACLSASTSTTALFLLTCIGINFRQKYVSTENVLKPMISWKSALKVGFCLGLSFVTVFYSWEQDKVPCNFQDPLLGLVIIFAIITHAVTKWNNVGLKRTFALSSIAAGVFLSVDYPLVDHQRCRGFYYRNQMSELWTWKVHLVWTLAFIISIWLATVAVFFMESFVPLPKVKHNRLYDLEFNAVKLRVLKGPERSDDNDVPSLNSARSYKYSPYTNFGMEVIINSVLWFSIATWSFIVCLAWTEFIPGFGRGITPKELPEKIYTSFYSSFTSGASWALFCSVYVFSYSFIYLIVLTRSPITAVAVAVIGFPIIGLWWSFFQIQYSFFVWMPVFSGELICATLGLLSVIIGDYYFIKYEILMPAKHKDNNLSCVYT